MSLPPATRDISNKPAAGAVTDPVDKQAKDADVDRKIQLYGVIEAFRLGRTPSNEQIDHALQFVLDHPLINTDKLSSEGKKLVQDTRDIIETAREMVQKKNADELFQQFVWHTREVDREGMKGAVKVNAPEGVDKEKVSEDQQQAVRHLRTLLSIVLTNSEVRKLLSDFSTIGRDLLSTVAKEAATLIAPDADKLAKVDEPGPNDQFVTEGGRTAGTGETPVLEARIPGTDATLKHHPRQDDDVKLRSQNGTERPVGEMAREGKEAVGSEYEAQRSAGGTIDQDRVKEAGRGVMDRADVDNEDVREVVGNGRADKVKQEAKGVVGDAQESGSEPEGETEAKKQGFLNKMKGYRDNITDRIPQEHKDRIDRGKKHLIEDYFPEERRDQFIFRGKKVIIECQKHDDYQESLQWLIAFIEEYAKHGRKAGVKGKEGVTAAAQDQALQNAINEIRTLLERFANGMSMDIVLDAFEALRDDAQRDQELSEWFKQVDAYVRKVLLEPGYVLQPACNTQASNLRDSGRNFYDEKYKEHFDNLFKSVGDWFKAMGDDPLNKRFGEDWARLTRDLLFDSEGSLKFKKHLWNDVRKVILPELVNKVGYIPIPRIEYTDESLDLVVENLALSGRNLFPNVIALEAHNYVRFSPYSAIKDESRHRFTLTFSQMQADMRDVAFYFKKKTGMPRLTDSGLADVVIGGEGLSATVSLVSAGKDKSSVFKVDDVHVKVDSLKFRIRDSKHDFLYKTLRPLATGLVKRQIQKAIRDALHTGLEYVDGQLISVRDKMEMASKEEDGQGRAEVLKDLFARKKDEGAGKAEHGASHFKVVSSKRNSLLSSAGHPAGWVNRTAEKDEEAKRGNEWRSEAFNVPVVAAAA